MKKRIIEWLKAPSNEHALQIENYKLTNMEVMLSDIFMACMLGVSTGTILGYFYLMWKG